MDAKMASGHDRSCAERAMRVAERRQNPPWARRASALGVALCLGAVGLANSGCASETAAPADLATGPREVTLNINQGLELKSGKVLPNANYLSADLMLYKNKNGFDLKPGAPGLGQSMSMGVFEEGGVEMVFASLSKVPRTKASAKPNAYMSNLGAGYGAVVQHNLDDGWSRIWIKQAISAAGAVVIQWDAIE